MIVGAAMVSCSVAAMGGPGGGEDLIIGLAVAVGASKMGEVERVLELDVRSREDCFAIVRFEDACDGDIGVVTSVELDSCGCSSRYEAMV